MLTDPATSERTQCLRLIREGGAGWFPYTIRKAEGLESHDPDTFRGITKAVEAEIGKSGPQAVDAARRAAKWMEGK